MANETMMKKARRWLAWGAHRLAASQWLLVSIESALFALVATLLWRVLHQQPLSGHHYWVYLTLAGLVSAGAWLHTFRRWLNSRRDPLVGTFSERLRGVFWIAWLGLAGAAAAGGYWTWHDLKQMPSPPAATAAHAKSVDKIAKVAIQKHPGEPASVGNSANPDKDGFSAGDYLTALGLAITIITAFYLLLLHRSADEARVLTEELRGYKERLDRIDTRNVENLKEELHILSRLTNDQIKHLLHPLLSYVDRLLREQKIHDPNFSKMRDSLLAQELALSLVAATTPQGFEITLKNFLGSSPEGLRQTGYLAHRADQLLDQFHKTHPWAWNEEEYRNFKRILEDWGESYRPSV